MNASRIKLNDVDRENMRAELQKTVSENLPGKDYTTICNHIRFLHRTCTTDEQKALCEEIIYLAKKMDKSLRSAKNGS